MAYDSLHRAAEEAQLREARQVLWDQLFRKGQRIPDRILSGHEFKVSLDYMVKPYEEERGRGGEKKKKTTRWSNTASELT